MDETWSRWKGRLGALKPYAFFIVLIAAFLLLGLINRLQVALKNPSGPQEVSISQLTRNEIGADRHITVTGIAVYQMRYEETENGKLVAIIYPLVDADTGDMLFVRTQKPELAAKVENEIVTLSGMTRNSPSDLKQLIQSDLPDITAAGLKTNATLYLSEGQEPEQARPLFLQTGGVVLLVLLCVVTFFFPSTVFHPAPVQKPLGPIDAEAGVKATGKLQKVIRLQPTLELGNQTRRFKESNANILLLDEKLLMVYIHHILTYHAYGIPLRRQESDWGLLIEPSHIVHIDSGKLLSWRDRSAVRLRYKDSSEKEETLYISFNHTRAQYGFIDMLRQAGYPIGSVQIAVG